MKKFCFVFFTLLIMLSQAHMLLADDDANSIFFDADQKAYYVEGSMKIQSLAYDTVNELDIYFNRSNLQFISSYEKGKSQLTLFDIREFSDYRAIMFINKDKKWNSVLIKDGEYQSIDLTENRLIRNLEPYFSGENISYKLLEPTIFEGTKYYTIQLKQENEKHTGFQRDIKRLFKEKIFTDLSPAAQIETDVVVTYLISEDTNAFSYALYSFFFYVKDAGVEYVLDINTEYSFHETPISMEKEEAYVEDSSQNLVDEIYRDDSILYEIMNTIVFGEHEDEYYQ